MSAPAAAASPDANKNVPLDHLLGFAPNGTPAYSNGGDKVTDGGSDASNQKDGGDGKPINPFLENGVFGVRWQCVEFARRWLWDAKGLILPDIHVAAQIFHLSHVFDANKKPVSLKSFKNGGKDKPVKDSFIIYSASLQNFPGHIGVIADVSDNAVFVADQNRFFHPWEGKTYSKSFPLKHDGSTGTYTIIDDEEPVLGWVTFPGAAPNAEHPIVTQDHNQVSADIAKGSAAANSLTSPLVVPRDRVLHPRRPMPKELMENLPQYDASYRNWLWLDVCKNFSPSPFIFPFYFVYMISKYMVVRPLLQKLGLIPQ